MGKAEGTLRFSFEVKEADLLGRVGILKVGGKTLETPCLLPVIHPVSQVVPADQMKAMGFCGLMTNSFIISSRRREETIRQGIHNAVGFDGVLMTDSGGYQVLEYGDIGANYREVASFQARIGSDLAVTLDKPTGYPQTRIAAKETVEYSLKNAVSTLGEYGSSDTTWLGPIQGGLYFDLVSKSSASLFKAGFEFLALGSPVQVMKNYMFADLVRMIVAARRPLPYSVPLHLFGAGHPLTMALAVALGCDTFDSASYILFARNGRYMSRDGILRVNEMKFLPCSCAACTRTSMRDLREMEEQERTRVIATHNLYVLKEEVESCKEAIAEGRLWDLVEEKSMTHPLLRDAFVEYSRHRVIFAESTPLLKERGLMIRSNLDMERPELVNVEKRLRGVCTRTSSTATLIAKWDSVPMKRNKPREIGSDKPDCYRIHPIFGTYPMELDFVYPFTQMVLAGCTGRIVSPGRAARNLKELGYKMVKACQNPRKGSRLRLKNRQSQRDVSPSLGAS